MTSLSGQLLVAGPDLVDPNFRRTVVLVGEHGEAGAMGVVLNRPSEVTVGEAVPPLAPLTGEDAPVFVGGPVQEEAIVVLGEFSEPGRAGVVVFGDVGFLPGEVDEDTAAAVTRARVYAGYAGWAPGQLELELAEGSWIVEPAQPDDVFAEDPGELWSAILRRKGGPYAVVALMPDDPGAN